MLTLTLASILLVVPMILIGYSTLRLKESRYQSVYAQKCRNRIILYAVHDARHDVESMV